MNLPQTFADWMRPLFQKFLAFGVQNAAREEAAHIGAEVIRSQKELGSVAGEALDAARSLGADGDPHKQAVADLLSEGIVETVRIYKQVATLDISASEGVEALAANPFSQGSKPIETNSAPRNGSMALEDQTKSETNGQEHPQRRGPGRPPGSKNKVRHEHQNGEATR